MLQPRRFRNYEFRVKKRKREILPTTVRFAFSAGIKQAELAKVLKFHPDSLSHTIVNSDSLPQVRAQGKRLHQENQKLLLFFFDRMIEALWFG